MQVKDLDDYMEDDGIFNAVETKDNFYAGEIENSDYNLVSKKKKKKPMKKKKNLFKDGGK